MNKAIFKRITLSSIICMAMISFLLHFPMTCYGEEESEPCPLSVEVSPYQVNINSGGVSHYVRVLTYTSYSNTKEVFVYINEIDDAIASEYIELTRDSVGHLVVKIDLEALQDAKLDTESYHDLTIAVELKEPVNGCSAKEGIGEIYIIGKKGDY